MHILELTRIVRSKRNVNLPRVESEGCGCISFSGFPAGWEFFATSCASSPSPPTDNKERNALARVTRHTVFLSELRDQTAWRSLAAFLENPFTDGIASFDALDGLFDLGFTLYFAHWDSCTIHRSSGPSTRSLQYLNLGPEIGTSAGVVQNGLGNTQKWPQLLLPERAAA